ncbi:hypothetical protein DFH27DRAFT_618198 [Peziza echinospora]|nr:hypothetical protein DFH27DRAFT_618198 [Peziza echinospora]
MPQPLPLKAHTMAQSRQRQGKHVGIGGGLVRLDQVIGPHRAYPEPPFGESTRTNAAPQAARPASSRQQPRSTKGKDKGREGTSTGQGRRRRRRVLSSAGRRPAGNPPTSTAVSPKLQPSYSVETEPPTYAQPVARQALHYRPAPPRNNPAAVPTRTPARAHASARRQAEDPRPVTAPPPPSPRRKKGDQEVSTRTRTQVHHRHTPPPRRHSHPVSLVVIVIRIQANRPRSAAAPL